jgi:RNA polymerase sigma factor (sigma-70 family)
VNGPKRQRVLRSDQQEIAMNQELVASQDAATGRATPPSAPTASVVTQDEEQKTVDVLLRQLLPSLRRWARGRLPSGVRGHFDTGDLIQDVVSRSVPHLKDFDTREVGGFQAYLRKAILNRVRDHARWLRRHPVAVELDDNCASDNTTPLESAIRRQSRQRFGEALLGLRSKDRQLILARLELQSTFPEIARRFNLASAAAARMAVNRAVRRLKDSLD